MPITKSAKKAAVSALAKRSANQARRKNYKVAVKEARANATVESMARAQKSLDKAAKGGTIHKNKASRLKSRLAKSMSQK